VLYSPYRRSGRRDGDDLGRKAPSHFLPGPSGNPRSPTAGQCQPSLHLRRESRYRQSRACYGCCWATVWIGGSTGEPDPIWLRSTTISDAFLDTPLFPKAIQPASFPPVKELAITNPVQSLHDDKLYEAAIVRPARPQRTGRVPFERVELYTTVPPSVIEEMEAFVNPIEWYDGTLSDEDEP
jgi:hypothetical protein